MLNDNDSTDTNTSGLSDESKPSNGSSIPSIINVHFGSNNEHTDDLSLVRSILGELQSPEIRAALERIVAEHNKDIAHGDDNGTEADDDVEGTAQVALPILNLTHTNGCSLSQSPFGWLPNQETQQK